MNKNFGEAIAATGILTPKTFDEIRDELLDMFGFVGATEIAERAGVSQSAVSMWQKRHADFPKPVIELAMGPIWSWRDVEPWVERQKAKGPGRPKKTDDG